jgi:hypothetical protein
VKTKWRVIEVQEGWYEVQYCPWWNPFWIQWIDTGNLDYARYLVEYYRKPFEPKVLDI